MSYVQVPPDGAGKKVHSVTHSISGSTIETQANHIVSPTNPLNAVEIDNDGAMITRYAEGSPLLAPYGDMKVIQEHIVGVYEHTIDSYDDLFFVEELSGGTSTYENEYSSVLMSVTEDSGSICKRMTNRYHYYQPGNSMMIILSVAMGDTGKVGNIRSWGYSDEDYGFLFELDGEDLIIEIRGTENGSFTNRMKIPQTEWNSDKLDGTGKSGIILDITKQYQYYINLSYPFGSVEFGIYSAEHGRVRCHKMIGDGVFNFAYVKYGSLPIFYQNRNTDITGTGSDMRVVSAVIKSEGNTDYT